MSTVSNEQAPGLMDQVRREIDQEVRRLRASGAFPPSFEAHLEDLFTQVVPAGVVERETAEAIRQLESVSHLDVEVPIASDLPGGSAAKHALRRLMAWYFEYLAAQLNRFMSSTVRVLRLMEERVAALEAAAPVAGPIGGPGDERGGGVDLALWAQLVVERLAAAGLGRVCHAECGAGELLRRLVAAGVDAYGVDARADLLDQAVRMAPGRFGEPGRSGEPGEPGLDVRWVDPLDHLRGLEDASLGGLVLSGCVDRSEVGVQRELAALAALKVAPGGVVAVVGTTPSAWLARRVGLHESGIVEADLAIGRPLHPQTWAWMLGAEGLSEVEVIVGGQPAAELGDAPADPRLASIVALLSGPTSFAVVATRPAARPWP